MLRLAPSCAVTTLPLHSRHYWPVGNISKDLVHRFPSIVLHEQYTPKKEQPNHTSLITSDRWCHIPVSAAVLYLHNFHYNGVPFPYDPALPQWKLQTLWAVIPPQQCALAHTSFIMVNCCRQCVCNIGTNIAHHFHYFNIRLIFIIPSLSNKANRPGLDDFVYWGRGDCWKKHVSTAKVVYRYSVLPLEFKWRQLWK